jgi:predicted ATP-grasp superfamily ATP-dependent carboligase/protein-tyrosine-phosphatase
MISRGKALILGNDTRSFLTVVRSLGRKGVEVHVAWCDRDLPSRHSRYVSRCHRIARYRPDDDTWQQALQTLLKSENFNLVIPCDDPSIIPLQTNRRLFEDYARIYLLPDHVFETTFDKEKTRRLAAHLGIPVAREIRIDGKNIDNPNMTGISFPVVVKPLSSFSHNDTVNRRYVEKASTIEDFHRIVDRMFPQGPVLVQEHFFGRGAGVEVLATSGEILAAFQHERVHEPLWGGGSSYRKSVPLDHELFTAARKLIEALRYTGVAMIEFMVSPRNGSWILVETNARFWGSLPLSVAAGVDFPWYLYDLLVNNKRPKPMAYGKNVFCRNLVLDLEWFRANLFADKSDEMLHTVPLQDVAAEAFHVFSGRERSDTFVLDDPLPGLVDLFMWVQAKVGSAKRKFDDKLLCLRNIREWQQRRIVKQIRRGKDVHFACTGNICRSPFAFYLAKKNFYPNFNLSSSGVSTLPGRPCPDPALSAAGRLGIAMEHHRSVQFDRAMLTEQSVVFVFDTKGYDALVRDIGLPKNRVCFLGLFSDGGRLEIQDPFGGDDAAFDRSFSQIQQAVLNLTRLCEPTTN